MLIKMYQNKNKNIVFWSVIQVLIYQKLLQVKKLVPKKGGGAKGKTFFNQEKGIVIP